MKYHIELHLWVVIFATFLKIAEVLVTLMKYALYATEAHIHDSAFNIISFNLLLTEQISHISFITFITTPQMSNYILICIDDMKNVDCSLCPLHSVMERSEVPCLASQCQYL